MRRVPVFGLLLHTGSLWVLICRVFGDIHQSGRVQFQPVLLCPAFDVRVGNTCDPAVRVEDGLLWRILQ